MITIQKNPTCFLIDDDDDERDFLLQALSILDSAFTCLRAKDALEGLTMLSSGEILPMFILLDLPKMSGRECLTQLRKVPHLSETPIYIYTTAHCSPVLVSNMIAAGANNVLTKPVRMHDFVKLIRRLIDQSLSN